MADTTASDRPRSVCVAWLGVLPGDSTQVEIQAVHEAVHLDPRHNERRTEAKRRAVAARPDPQAVPLEPAPDGPHAGRRRAGLVLLPPSHCTEFTGQEEARTANVSHSSSR